MNPLIQSILFVIYRFLRVSGILSTKLGRSVFFTAYSLLKSRIDAAPVKHLKQFVTPGTVVLDIGANIGFFTRHFGTWVSDGGRVIGIEPEPANCRILRESVVRFGLNTLVEVIEGVATDRIGDAFLEVSDLHPGDHRVGKEGIPVRSYTVDALMEERRWPHVSLVKIDVQGTEERVLDGARTTLERCRPVIFIEVHDASLRKFQSSAMRLLGRLANSGYSLRSVNNDGISAPMSPEEAERMLGSSENFADFLCLPAGTADTS